MDDRKRWLIFWIVVILIVIFFNLKYLGLSVINTTSDVRIISPYHYPQFGEINTSLYICEGQRLYYEFNATDSNSDALTGDLSPKNPFYVGLDKIFIKLFLQLFLDF
jgi:hypothetical protein